MERRRFLKAILAGLAAAPVAANARVTSYREIEDVRVKKWTHDGVKFAEWTLPAHVGPYFEEVKDAKEVKDADPVGTWSVYAPRRYIVPVFNTKVVKSSMDKLVSKVLETFHADQERIGGNGTKDYPRVKGYKKLKATHFLVIKVNGKPDMLGLGAFTRELVPVGDFYGNLR